MSSHHSEEMPKRHLLLYFDAFGTLFTPKCPIPQQYGDVARSLGHSGFTDDQLQSSFKAAFKAEAKENPNFGKANGMNPTKWWTNVRSSVDDLYIAYVGINDILRSSTTLSNPSSPPTQNFTMSLRHDFYTASPQRKATISLLESRHYSTRSAPIHLKVSTDSPSASSQTPTTAYPVS